MSKIRNRVVRLRIVKCLCSIILEISRLRLVVLYVRLAVLNGFGLCVFRLLDVMQTNANYAHLLLTQGKVKGKKVQVPAHRVYCEVFRLHELQTITPEYWSAVLPSPLIQGECQVRKYKTPLPGLIRSFPSPDGLKTDTSECSFEI